MRSLSKGTQRKKCRGAAVVEVAISLIVFLVVLLGIMDMTFLLFKMTKGVDVARETARQIIVSEPLTALDVLGGCDELGELINKTAEVNCDGDCDDYAQSRLPDYLVGDVTVVYGCSAAGNLVRGRFSDDLIIPQVRVNVVVRYSFLFSEILFGENSLTIDRTFSVTRTGEDIDTA